MFHPRAAALPDDQPDLHRPHPAQGSDLSGPATCNHRDGLWNAVQAQLIAARARPRGRTVGATEARTLTGKLRDETGDRLTPTHTVRRGRRFSYYVSHRLIAGGTDPSGWRLPAEALEATLQRIIGRRLREAANRHALLATPDVLGAGEIAHRTEQLVADLEKDPAYCSSLISSVDLEHGRIRISLAPEQISAPLGIAAAALSSDLLSFTCAFSLRRRGVETRIVAGETSAAPDETLLRTLAEAHSWAEALRAGKSLAEIAVSTVRSEPYIRTRIPFAFLAPRLQATILDGHQPPDLSVARLLREGIPADWTLQLRLFAVT